MMDFDSPDVMKHFPGLYASEINKKASNDSDYSDDADKVAKKDILGKRKDKKDKKDKDRGYAALEGESSAEETDAKGLSKLKKTKAFKFASSKSKEKREKSREKEVVEKKKDKEKKIDKKLEKDKLKAEKKEKKHKGSEEHGDIAEGLPIFGVPLELSVERSRCHDGVDVPLPVRACIDHIQNFGLNMEGVYKISGTKSKVIQLRKLYNQREYVDLTEYDVPIATSLLKMYLRDLPEPVFTNDLLIRFEEAGAILNIGTREKHLKILVENLPKYNSTLLAWLLIHFDNIVLNERINKMNIQHFAASLGPVLHTSSKLLTTLLHHCRALFPTVVLDTYIPPVSSIEELPETLEALDKELRKQESLLSQIHSEMNSGFITKTREELLWEVQRIITQLKRKIKNLQKEWPSVEKKCAENDGGNSTTVMAVDEVPVSTAINEEPKAPSVDPVVPVPVPSENTEVTCNGNVLVDEPPQKTLESNDLIVAPRKISIDNSTVASGDGEDYVALLQKKNSALKELKSRLEEDISNERAEIVSIKKQLVKTTNSGHTIQQPFTNEFTSDFEKLLHLLQKENQILQIKKVNLVRKIMEQEEACINLKAKLSVTTS